MRLPTPRTPDDQILPVLHVRDQLLERVGLERLAADQHQRIAGRRLGGSLQLSTSQLYSRPHPFSGSRYFLSHGTVGGAQESKKQEQLRQEIVSSLFPGNANTQQIAKA